MRLRDKICNHVKFAEGDAWLVACDIINKIHGEKKQKKS